MLRDATKIPRAATDARQWKMLRDATKIPRAATNARHSQKYKRPRKKNPM